jgi:hypothetical protein
MAYYFTEQVAPSAPSAGKVVLYAKADGLLYAKDDAGVEKALVVPSGLAVTTDGLDQFAATTSAELAGVISDETGSGLLVFNDTPSITALKLAAGAATANDAPLEFTSGPLLTTPEAGTVEFLDGIIYATQDATLGRGQNVVEQMMRLTADNIAIGSAIADMFGANSAISLEANSAYEIIAEGSYGKTTAGTVTYTLTCSAAVLAMAGDYAQTETTGYQAVGAIRGAGARNISGPTSLALPATGSLTTAVNHKFRIRYIVETDATPVNARLRATNSAGTLTLHRGSVLSIRKLPPATVGNFVA